MSYGVLTTDLEARWRPLSAAETTVARTLIDSATVQLDTIRPRLRENVTLGLIPIRLVVDAICDVVQRVLRNPDLLRAQNITGDGGVGLTFGLGEDTNHALPRLRFSEDDLIVLDRALDAIPGAGSKVKTIRLVAE